MTPRTVTRIRVGWNVFVLTAASGLAGYTFGRPGYVLALIGMLIGRFVLVDVHDDDDRLDDLI